MRLREMVIASGNRHKFDEFQRLLYPLGVTLLFGKDFASVDVEETGNSFLENASLKACAWAWETGRPSLADDSGIEVTALDRRPGVRSARVGVDDAACRQWLLDALAGIDDRSACYTAALVLALPDGSIAWSVEEHCFGDVALEPRGANGFGYDPLFIPQGYEMTFGELAPDVKSVISHRARAARCFVSWLASKKNMIQ